MFVFAILIFGTGSVMTAETAAAHVPDGISVRLPLMMGVLAMPLGLLFGALLL